MKLTRIVSDGIVAR